MIAVMLHEGSHASQFATYGAQMTALTEKWRLPDTFGDDSIQDRFAPNAEFSASVARETELFLNAASAPDRASAIVFALYARSLMIARQAKYYPASDGYLRQTEDIWLTMEGSGQWAGYEWLTSRSGGRVPPALATTAFGTRGKSWSQREGFAIFEALTRLTGNQWKGHVYGDGQKTVLTMMDEAVRRD